MAFEIPRSQKSLVDMFCATPEQIQSSCVSDTTCVQKVWNMNIPNQNKQEPNILEKKTNEISEWIQNPNKGNNDVRVAHRAITEIFGAGNKQLNAWNDRITGANGSWQNKSESNRDARYRLDVFRGAVTNQLPSSVISLVPNNYNEILKLKAKYYAAYNIALHQRYTITVVTWCLKLLLSVAQVMNSNDVGNVTRLIQLFKRQLQNDEPIMTDAHYKMLNQMKEINTKYNFNPTEYSTNKETKIKTEKITESSENVANKIGSSFISWLFGLSEKTTQITQMPTQTTQSSLKNRLIDAIHAGNVSWLSNNNVLSNKNIFGDMYLQQKLNGVIPNPNRIQNQFDWALDLRPLKKETESNNQKTNKMDKFAQRPLPWNEIVADIEIETIKLQSITDKLEVKIIQLTELCSTSKNQRTIMPLVYGLAVTCKKLITLL